MQHNHQPINPVYHKQRARLHLWQDGIFEILIGIAAVLFNMFSAVLTTSGGSPPARIIVEVVMMAVLFFAGFIVFRYASESAKAHFTYPRSGFVRLRREQPQMSPPALMLRVILYTPLSAGLGVGLAVAFVHGMAALGIDISLSLLSSLYALGIVALARRVHQRRFYGLAIGVLTIGVGLSVFGPHGESGVMLLILLMGLLTALSGCVTLWRYLRHHPLQDSAQEETAHGCF